MNRDTKTRAGLSALCALGGALALCGGVWTVAGLAAATAPPAPGVLAPVTQLGGALHAFHDRGPDAKRWRTTRSNTHGVEFRWRLTPGDWIDVQCRAAVVPAALLAERTDPRVPVAAELRVAGATHPLQPAPDGSLAARVPRSLFGPGLTNVQLLAWDAGADASDDGQAFLWKGADVRR